MGGGPQFQTLNGTTNDVSPKKGTLREQQQDSRGNTTTKASANKRTRNTHKQKPTHTHKEHAPPRFPHAFPIPRQHFLHFPLRQLIPALHSSGRQLCAQRAADARGLRAAGDFAAGSGRRVLNTGSGQEGLFATLWSKNDSFWRGGGSAIFSQKVAKRPPLGPLGLDKWT